MVHWYLSVHSSSFTCLHRIYYSLRSTGSRSNSFLEGQLGWSSSDLIYGTSQMSKEQLAQLYPTVIPIIVVKYLYPSGATLYTFLTAWASFTLLGMILYLVSLISKNILWGLAVTGIIVFLDPILMWLAWPKNYWLQYFSPVCWTSVESLDSVQAHRALTIPAVSALYVILLLASFVAIYYQSKRIMITDLQGNNEQ